MEDSLHQPNHNNTVHHIDEQEGGGTTQHNNNGYLKLTDLWNYIQHREYSHVGHNQTADL